MLAPASSGQLKAFRIRGLLTDEEFGRFSEEIRQTVPLWIQA